jgi:hypothetical protein
MELLCKEKPNHIQWAKMFAHYLAISTPLSERDLHSQIQKALRNKLTGRIQIAFLNDRTVSIFVVQGTVRQVYIRNHRVPNLQWQTPISRYGTGILTIEPMPLRVLMFQKIILEEIMPTKPQVANTVQLKAFCGLAENNPGPTLFHIQWTRAEGFVLVAGKGIPRRYAVLLTPAGAEEGRDALNQISGWDEARCRVTIRRGDIKSQAWLEAHLNILFERYCAMILNHYGHLTGSVVVQALVRKISMLAIEAGLNIEASKAELQAASLLSSAAEAGEVYRRIFAIMRSQIEPVIGEALTRNIFKQAYDSSRDIYRSISEVFELPEKASS